MQPRIDRLSCQTYPLGGTAGPTAQAQRRRLLQTSANAKLGMVSWACGNQHSYKLRLFPGFESRQGQRQECYFFRMLDSVSSYIFCRRTCGSRGECASQLLQVKLPHYFLSVCACCIFQQSPCEQGLPGCRRQLIPDATCPHLQNGSCCLLLQVLPEITERWAYNGLVANGRHVGRAADVREIRELGFLEPLKP